MFRSLRVRNYRLYAGGQVISNIGAWMQRVAQDWLVLELTHIAAMNTLARFGPMTPGELAAHEMVQPPSMSRVLASLEDRGLVVRAPHPTDGRQVIVALTDAGNTLIEEVRAREAWLSQRLKALSNEDRETLQNAIEVINKLIDS